MDICVAFSIGIEMDFVIVSSILNLFIFNMNAKMKEISASINMFNILCVMGCGAQLESLPIPIARNESISILN